MATQNAWNSNIPVSVSFGGTGATSLTAHSLLLGEGTSAVTPLGAATNGQIPIGSTGADPVLATFTAGTNISISNGAGTITVNATGSAAFTWNDVTGTSASMAVNNGYVADNAGLVTLTLPSTAAFGSIIEVTGGTSGLSSGSWKIAQNSGQTIHFGNVNTTTGAGGSLQATAQYDSIRLLCNKANTDFVVLPGTQGNITYV